MNDAPMLMLCFPFSQLTVSSRTCVGASRMLPLVAVNIWLTRDVEGNGPKPFQPENWPVLNTSFVIPSPNFTGPPVKPPRTSLTMFAEMFQRQLPITDHRSEFWPAALGKPGNRES